MFQWQGYDDTKNEFLPLATHTSLVLERALIDEKPNLSFETYPTGSLSLCKATVNIQEVIEKSAGLGKCTFEGQPEQCIRRMLMPEVKLVIWQERHKDGQWLQCNPGQSAKLASQPTVGSQFRSVEIKSDHTDAADLIPLGKDHPDWIRLQLRLKSSDLTEFDIVSLQKVINPTTQSNYVARRRLMAEKCNGNPNEREVFHLTSPNLLDTITKVGCVFL